MYNVLQAGAIDSHNTHWFYVGKSLIALLSYGNPFQPRRFGLEGGSAIRTSIEKRYVPMPRSRYRGGLKYIEDVGWQDVVGSVRSYTLQYLRLNSNEDGFWVDVSWMTSVLALKKFG